MKEQTWVGSTAMFPGQHSDKQYSFYIVIYSYWSFHYITNILVLYSSTIQTDSLIQDPMNSGYYWSSYVQDRILVGWLFLDLHCSFSGKHRTLVPLFSLMSSIIPTNLFTYEVSMKEKRLELDSYPTMERYKMCFC